MGWPADWEGFWASVSFDHAGAIMRVTAAYYIRIGGGNIWGIQSQFSRMAAA